MKIKSVKATRFKRFTDLSVTGIPPEAKLICLVGPNGSGKSSLFEVFNYCIPPSKNTGSFHVNPDYHIKVSAEKIDGSNWPERWGTGFQNVSVHFHDSSPIGPGSQSLKPESFYIRTSYRHEADVEVAQLQRLDHLLRDENRPPDLISVDRRVSDDYMRIVADSVAAIFSKESPDNATKVEIRDRLIGKARTALAGLFPDLIFEGVGNPMERGTFYFSKGDSHNWKYKNLSAGEKAAFDLLLDFTIKTEAFSDTVFCIDEPELHMHSELQAALLQELYRSTPPNCQLWIATHSVGMLRKAKELNDANPGSVSFLDFNGRDFDKAVEIMPARPDRTFWKETFRIALGDLAELVAPSRLVFCEGSQSSVSGTRSGEFDARCLRRIFSGEYPDAEFVSLGSAGEVQKNSLLLSSVFQQVLSAVNVYRVVDKDDRSPSEIQELQRKGFRVLSRRHIESFFFDDEIITKLCQSVGMADKVQDVLAAKAAAVKASVGRGNPSDDYKSMSSELYVQTKRLLNLTQCGNTKDAFCVDTLAPLITPDTAVYRQLKTDIMD